MDLLGLKCFTKRPTKSEQFKKDLGSIQLPNSLWAAHVDPKFAFVAFLHLDPRDLSRIAVDKALILTFGTEDAIAAKVYLNGEAVEVPELDLKIETVAELAHFLAMFEKLRLCKGNKPDCKKYSQPGNNGDFCTRCSPSKIACYGLLKQDGDFGLREGNFLQDDVKCEVCGKCFAERAQLKEHSLLHLSSYPYNCDIYPKPSSHRTEFHKPGHSGDKGYLCSTCGKKFNGKYRMESHMQTHDKDKKHECRVCLKKFASSNNLKIHHRSHSNDIRPYSCNICGKCYTTPSNLSTHIKGTHLEEKPYKCTICDVSFVHPRLLRIHMRKHTGERPFACEVCGKTFAKKVHLTVHERTHTGEKPFECPTCGKGFTTTGNLTSHKRVHQKEPSCNQ